jgi:hypothetical protein
MTTARSEDAARRRGSRCDPKSRRARSDPFTGRSAMPRARRRKPWKSKRNSCRSNPGAYQQGAARMGSAYAERRPGIPRAEDRAREPQRPIYRERISGDCSTSVGSASTSPSPDDIQRAVQLNQKRDPFRKGLPPLQSGGRHPARNVGDGYDRAMRRLRVAERTGAARVVSRAGALEARIDASAERAARAISPPLARSLQRLFQEVGREAPSDPRRSPWRPCRRGTASGSRGR